MSIFQKLKERFPGVRENEPLKNHCTFRVGGPADLFYEMTNIEELPELVSFAEANSIRYKLIGRGTNVLFTDKGFRGLIIKNLSKEIRFMNGEIIADSGVLLSQIIRFSVENNLTGLEPLYGLPGTIGAAAWGNAGVPHVEIGNFIRKVVLFNAGDGVHEVPRENFEMRYRSTSMQDRREMVMRVFLKLAPGSSEHSKEVMKKINEIRLGKQPTGYSAGSFFKNPSKEQPAGLLIDQVGMKGARKGDAEISPKHANFFMNRGNATAADILALAEEAKNKVREKFGVELEMEVKVIGDL